MALSIMAAHMHQLSCPAQRVLESTDFSRGLQMGLSLHVDTVPLPRVSLVLHPEDASYFRRPVALN